MGTLYKFLRKIEQRRSKLLWITTVVFTFTCVLQASNGTGVGRGTGATTGFQLVNDAFVIDVEPSPSQQTKDESKTSRHKRQLFGGAHFGGGLFPPGWPFQTGGTNPVSVSQPQQPQFPQLPQFPGFPQFPGIQYPGISNIQHLQPTPATHPTHAPTTTTTTTTTPSPPSFGGSTGPCQTNNGLLGYCASFRQCFPKVYSPDDGSIMNSGLAEMYLNNSGPCNRPDMSNLFMFRADAELRQNQICCGASIAQQPTFPGFPFGQYPGFPFPQVTMRPPWAPPAKISTTTATTTTTTTTTTQQPTQAPPQWPGWPPRPQSTTTANPWWNPPSTTKASTTVNPWWNPPSTTKASTTVNPWWNPPSTTTTTQRPTPAHTTASPPVSSSCGVGKIVGGSQAGKGEFPWLVALIRNGRQVCGGSLIDSQYILTAAHCFNGITSYELQTLFKVYIGDYDLHTLSDGPMTVKSISKLIIHKDFHQQYFYNDIALLKLDSPVQFGSNGNNDIRPICLSAGGPYEGMQAIVAGWGRTSAQSAYQPGIYRKVDLQVWNINQCAARYGSAAPGGITSHMMCAGATSKDSCLGDSGGPLMRRVGTRWEQIGLVSWGIGCGTYPGVYTKIADYQDWISRHRSY